MQLYVLIGVGRIRMSLQSVSTYGVRAKKRHDVKSELDLLVALPGMWFLLKDYIALCAALQSHPSTSNQDIST